MTERERLSHIADLFGGVNDLARALRMSASGLSRRLNGHIQITHRDWTCIGVAVGKRIQDLRAALPDDAE